MLLLFITSLPYVQYEYNLYYRATLAICAIVTISQKEFIPIFFSKFSVPIIICLEVFFVFWFIDYGDRSFNTMLSFVRAFVVFIMVFVMASREQRLSDTSYYISRSSMIFLTEVMLGGGLLSTSVMSSRNENRKYGCCKPKHEAKRIFNSIRLYDYCRRIYKFCFCSGLFLFGLFFQSLGETFSLYTDDFNFYFLSENFMDCACYYFGYFIVGYEGYPCIFCGPQKIRSKI